MTGVLDGQMTAIGLVPRNKAVKLRNPPTISLPHINKQTSRNKIKMIFSLILELLRKILLLKIPTKKVMILPIGLHGKMMLGNLSTKRTSLEN
jgi:hypothetical protein